MKKLQLKLDEKKPTTALKKAKPTAAAGLNGVEQGEKQDLAHAEDLARLLDVESRKELSALLAAYPALADDPEVRALDAAIQQDIANRVTPGLHSLHTRVRQQRARIEEIRRKLKLVEQEVSADEDGDLPVPGKLPHTPFHAAGDHASEYDVLAKNAHRATQRVGGRRRNKVAGETTAPHDDAATESASDTSDEAPTDTHNDGQSLTGFH